MKNKLIFFLGLLIPAIFVYKAVLLSGSLAFADAPYFYPEALNIFLQKPLAWWNIGNGLGEVNLLIWISPLMYLYSYLGARLTFYFPAIIFSFLSPIIFTRFFKFSKTTQFFSSLVYGLNTYIILLIDGGQVGVALAYSFFPLVLLSLLKLTNILNYRNFFNSFLLVFALILMDPRIAIIAFLTILFWKPKKIFSLMLLGLSLIPVNMFWLLSLYKNGENILSLEVSSLELTSLLNSFFLYQPHWPSNIYGQITNPPFYFALIPILIFFGIFFNKDKDRKILKKLALLFLIFAFLAKGENDPFGFIYKFIISKIPLGSTLRDSSKFFIPLMLFGGVLIGNTIDQLKSKVVQIVCYILLLLLITPALLGKLNFVLSNRIQSDDYRKIYNNLKDDSSSYKTLWFPEKPTLGFSSTTNPAINAKSLVELRPFASLNVGSSDSFNFLNQPVSAEWLKILGVKYMFFPKDTRKFIFSEEEQDTWQRLLDNISENKSFKRIDWNTEMPVFEIVDYRQKSFKVNKMLAVVGGEDIYEKEKIDLTTTATIFLEDGKVNSNDLLLLDDGSIELIYNEKDKIDLRFSFLQDYFLNQNDIDKNDWAKYNENQYLLWKYQLLIRGIQTKEHDYQKGILFSTQSDEKITYNLNIKNDGKYIIGIRGMGDDNNKLLIETKGFKQELSQKNESFAWQYLEVNLEKGKQKLIINNEKSIQIINTIAIIPIDSWNLSEQKTIEFENKFSAKKGQIVTNWLIYSENYHSQLQIDCDGRKITPVAAYSMINGYLITNCPDVNNPSFVGQKYVDLGIKISLVYFAIISLWVIFITKFSR